MVIVTHESYDSVLVGRENRKVLSRCLKTASDGADATWRGRSFQTVAPETGNARLLTVERRTGGTSRRCEVEDRSRRLDVMSETRMKHDCKLDGEVPWMNRYVMTASLKEIRSATRSQCRYSHQKFSSKCGFDAGLVKCRLCVQQIQQQQVAVHLWKMPR